MHTCEMAWQGGKLVQAMEDWTRDLTALTGDGSPLRDCKRW